MVSDQIKIFVGNVPYYCTQGQFEITFKDVDGFIKGDIVTKPKSNICRGFGFVTIKDKKSAIKLKGRHDLYIKNRQLRFTDYILNDDKDVVNDHSVKQKYIFVDGLPNNSKREYLKETFNDYTLIKYFVKTDIETGIIKTNGMIELAILDDYKKLLERGFVKDSKGNLLKLSRWRQKPNQPPNQKKSSDDNSFNGSTNSEPTKYDIYKTLRTYPGVGYITEKTNNCLR